MSATIHYHDIGDYLSREEKLRIVDDFGDIAAVPWQTLTPDKHGDWLNKRDSEFDDYIPLAPEEKFDYLAKSWFTVYSSGLKTGRDAWAVNHSATAIETAMKKTIAYYDDQQKKHGKDTTTVDEDKKKISWNRSILQHFARGVVLGFEPSCIVPYAYRPFDKQFCYFNRYWNDMTYQMPSIFPPGDGKIKYNNKVIWVKSPGGSKDFSCLIADCIPDIQPDGGIQCFPLYWYERIERDDGVMELPGLEKQSGYIRHDAISDFILMEFRKIAGPHVQKEDIFYYVYGALHNPDYRAKFAADLKKQLPRLPLPKNRKDFEKVEKIGRDLANLHLHYEEIDPWPLDEIAKCCQYGNVASANSNDQLETGNIGTGNTGNNGNIFHVTKMAWAKDGKDVRKDMLVVNEHLTLAGIPAEAHQYVVNGRTPLEWLIDRYQIRTDTDSGIVNDPNKWGEEHNYPQYIVELAKRLVRLSVETVRLVGELGGRETVGTNGTTGTPLSRMSRLSQMSRSPHPSATPPYWWKSGTWGVESAMPEGGNIVIGLKQKWYDKIEAGFKHEEYREKKPYWDERLGGRKGKELRSVTFMRGQASPVQMTWEVLSVETATQPGYVGYYIIRLGKRIK